jgi:hypothetical protein
MNLLFKCLKAIKNDLLYLNIKLKLVFSSLFPFNIKLFGVLMY